MAIIHYSTFSSEPKFGVFYNLLLRSEEKCMSNNVAYFNSRQLHQLWDVVSNWQDLDESFTHFLTFSEHIPCLWHHRTPQATFDKVEFLKEAELERGWPQVRMKSWGEGWVGEELTRKL